MVHSNSSATCGRL